MLETTTAAPVMVPLSRLQFGDYFRFTDKSGAYRYAGDGWYGWPYSGGPWHTNERPVVEMLSQEEAFEINRR